MKSKKVQLLKNIMPKFPTFPTLYDNALQINISKLNEWGYLKPNQYKTGTLIWSTNGQKTGSISIAVYTYSDAPYLELKYRFKDQPRNYKVQLVSVPSNLGKGQIWYFRCPHTAKRCRVLYSIGGYFFHREAFTGVMYESQIQSKRFRNYDKYLGAEFKLDEYYSELYGKHFKTHYQGKPTKRYLELMKKIEQVEGNRLSARQMERLLATGKL